MKKISYLLAGLAMMTMSSPAYAVASANNSDTGVTSVVNINFVTADTNVFTGSAVIGTARDYWNSISPDNASIAGDPVVTTLLTPSGGIGSISPGLSFTAEGINAVIRSNTGFYKTDYQPLMNNYAWTPSTTVDATISIGGLNQNASYDVYVLTQGSKNGADNNGTQLKLTGYGYSIAKGWANQTFTQTGVSDATASTFINGQNYMLETFLTDNTGTLSFTYASNNGKNAIINGIQVAGSSNNGPGPTPEPASMLLIGVGGALISAARLRKKKSADNPVA